MAGTSRRNFLKASAGIAAGVSLRTSHAVGGESGQTLDGSIPLQEATAFPGLHAYAQKSIAAGEDIIFRVSSSVPYDLRVMRLAGEVDNPDSDIEVGSFLNAPAGVQPVHLGSYVDIAKSISNDEIKNGFSIECWLRPWGFNQAQGILTQIDDEGKGYGLFLRPDSRIELSWDSDGFDEKKQLATGEFRMARRVWTHIVAVFNDLGVHIYCDGELCASLSGSCYPVAVSAPIRIGSAGGKEGATQFLDGDIAMPVFYGEALNEAQIKKRFRQKALKPPESTELLACWPLTEENGDYVKDHSERGRDGTIINHGTWQIGGPSFHAESVKRYGQSYDPLKDAARGHSLRLCSDDLIDCRWKETHRLSISDEAVSGVYVGRFTYLWDGNPMQYDCTFIVRRSEQQPKSSILMICSTSTWLAYNCAPFPRPRPAGRDWNAPSLPGAPTYCCYHNHRAGQPTYYLGVNRPWPGAGADNLFSPKEVDYSHLMRGELFTHRWLDGVYDDTARYDYDVVTDWDVHNDPEILNGYKVVVVNGHSEYWSAEAFTGVDAYLTGGGNLMVMSGNTFFWRTSYSRDGSVMECRKYDARIGGRRAAPMGETWHSQDGNRGSLLRECGYPEYQFVGLACIGWDGLQKKEDYGIFFVTDSSHFLFNDPEDVPLEDGDSFGHAPDGGLPHAVGHEWDVRLPTLASVTTHIPLGAVLPDDEPSGIVTVAEGYRPAGGGTFDYFTNPARTKDGISAEMIYWDRPQGGRVLHFGAIAIGWALSKDPKLSAVVRNAMHHFEVPNVSNRNA
jgi:hypothetical protein